MGEQTTNGAPAPPSDERLRRAFDDGYAAAASGEEAAPGCTTTAEGRAFLRGYVAGAGAKARGLASAADER
jgi:ribosome modulation factor